MKYEILIPFYRGDPGAKKTEENTGVPAGILVSTVNALSHSAIITPCSKGYVKVYDKE